MNDRAVIMTLSDEVVERIQKQDGTSYSLLLLDNAEAREWAASITESLEQA